MRKYKNYKIKFNYYENTTFNQVETVRKTKLMSVYSYLVKYSVDNRLTKSASKLHFMYEKHHPGVCLSYFKELLLDLEKLRLIFIEKSKKIRTFFIPRVAIKVANEKTTESIDNANSEDDLEICNIESVNNNYTNNPNTQLENQNFGEKVAPVELVNVAKKIMKDLRIRSEWVKNEVEKNLAKCFDKVNRLGMDQYVLKVIIEKKAKQELRRQQFSKGKNIAISRFLDRNRKEYSHGEIERKFGIIV